MSIAIDATGEAQLVTTTRVRSRFEDLAAAFLVGYHTAKTREDWFADRACMKWREPSMWFSGYAEDIAAAKAICWSCPVRQQCLAYQLEWERRVGHAEYGIFGGRSPYERRVIMRHRGTTV